MKIKDGYIRNCGMALALAGWIFLSGCGGEQTAEPPPPGVTVTAAVIGSIADSAEIIGQAKADDSVDLVARVTGFLRKRNFIEGKEVKKGDLLFEIEKEQYQAEVMGAQAALGKAKAHLMNAQIEYERQDKLLKENATSKRNYDNALAAKMEAEAEVMSAQSQLDRASLNLSYTDILAPFDGRIGLATYSVGNVVGPESRSLANVSKLDPIRVEFNISEVDVLRLLRGAQSQPKAAHAPGINVRLVFQDCSVYSEPGKISYTANHINPSTGTLRLEALFTNSGHIIVPGMYVKVVIEDKEKTEALLVPQPAVMESLGGKYVLVVDKNNTVDTRMVKTGLKSGPGIQIVEGLKEGEMVIIEGHQKVRRGQKVAPLIEKNYALTADGRQDSAVARAARKQTAGRTADAGSETGETAEKTAGK